VPPKDAYEKADIDQYSPVRSWTHLPYGVCAIPSDVPRHSELTTVEGHMSVREGTALESHAAIQLGPALHPSISRARLIKLIGYLILFAGSLPILELAAYAYLRTFEGYDGVHLMSYEFDDYKNIRPTPNYRNTKGIYHNAQGFREDLNTPREKPPNTYRVFIMGGSTAYGLGSLSRFGKAKYEVIRNDQTIDHYLEQFLDGKLDKRVEVINAAITSQYSHHHLIYLNQTILSYSPDMVIFIDGFNDYYPYEGDFDQWRDYAYQERVHQFMDKPTLRAWVLYTGWWLFRKSHLVNVAGRAVRPLWIQFHKLGQERARIDVGEAIKNLERNAQANFVKMVERNGLILAHEHVKAAFTLQPEIVFKQSKKLSNLEQAIYDEMNHHWEENLVEYKNRALPLVRRLLKEATAKSNAAFIDLTDVFGGMEEDAYTDYTHLTPAGNRRVAEYLAERLLPMISEDIATHTIGLARR